MSSTIVNLPSTSVDSGQCITATPDPNGYVPLDDCRNLWPYYPSFFAAILFAALFGMSTIIHVIQAFIYRKKFCWVIIMAGLWETAGFILRTLATRNQISLGLYTPEELLILLAPLWINAFVYMTLGRMVYYFLPERMVRGITANKLAKYFVCMDIAAFVVQAIGGTITSGGQESETVLMVGIHIYMGGIGLQQLFILFFVYLAVIFHRRMLVLEKEGTLARNDKPNWKPLLYILYTSLALITVRIIFRLIQYSDGILSTIPTHEVYFYCFEALPMSIAMWLLNVTHPGRSLIGPESEFPKKTRQEKKEEKRRKKEAKKAVKEEKKRRKESRRQKGVIGELVELETDLGERQGHKYV